MAVLVQDLIRRKRDSAVLSPSAPLRWRPGAELMPYPRKRPAPRHPLPARPAAFGLSSLHTAEYLHETLALGQPQPLETFAGTLNRAGWHTAALYTRGIFFTEGDRLTAYRDNNFGFARAAHVDRMAAEQTQAAQEEVDDIARRGEPLSLLWVHYFDAHAPYQGQGPNPMAQYDAAARTVDGRIDALVRYARSRLRRPVVVAVTADHGEEFHEHGGVYHGATLHDEQVRVPMVLEGPGVPARRVETPVQLIDLVPTLLGLAGVTAPPTMRGRDLRPWMSPTPPTEAPTVGKRDPSVRCAWA